MKTLKNAVAQLFAVGSTLSLALGVAFTLTHGHIAALIGLAAFTVLGLIASTLNPTV